MCVCVCVLQLASCGYACLYARAQTRLVAGAERRGGAGACDGQLPSCSVRAVCSGCLELVVLPSGYNAVYSHSSIDRWMDRMPLDGTWWGVVAGVRVLPTCPPSLLFASSTSRSVGSTRLVGCGGFGGAPDWMEDGWPRQDLSSCRTAAGCGRVGQKLVNERRRLTHHLNCLWILLCHYY